MREIFRFSTIIFRRTIAATVLAAGLSVVSPDRARSAEGVADACAADFQLSADLALTATLTNLWTRHPWLQNVSLVCNNLAMGTRPEQAAFFTGCMAQACARRASANCARDAAAVEDVIRANAIQRSRQRQQRTRCQRTPELTASSGPLDAYFEWQLATYEGDEKTVRRLSLGTEQEFASTRSVVNLYGAINAFLNESDTVYGADLTELARLEVANSLKLRATFDRRHYREVINGEFAQLSTPVNPFTAHFRRVEGVWKYDIGRTQAGASVTNSEADHHVRLSTTGYQKSVEMVRAQRALPMLLVSAVNGCAISGLLIVNRSFDTAKEICENLIERKFPRPGRDSETARGVSSTAPMASERGSPQMESAVNVAFLRWSTTWLADRYIPDSVRIFLQKCGADECWVGGQFTVLRFGASINVSFTGNLGKSSSGAYALSKLCYRDVTSGMSDCIQ